MLRARRSGVKGRDVRRAEVGSIRGSGGEGVHPSNGWCWSVRNGLLAHEDPGDVYRQPVSDAARPRDESRFGARQRLEAFESGGVRGLCRRKKPPAYSGGESVPGGFLRAPVRPTLHAAGGSLTRRPRLLGRDRMTAFRSLMLARTRKAGSIAALFRLWPVGGRPWMMYLAGRTGGQHDRRRVRRGH
jgi:hypothetical protein